MKRIKWIFILSFLVTGLQAQNSLPDYLVMAAEQNPGLKAKYNLYLAALENVNQQGALPDPTLSFGYFISPVETRVGPQRFKLSLSQMFPWKGTLKTREQASAAVAKVRYEEFQEAKNQLFLEVKTKWLALYELNEEIRINQANLEILKSYEPVTKTKYEANLVSLADLIRVQIKVEDAITQLKLLELKRIPLLSDFNTLLNRALDTAVNVNQELSTNGPELSLDTALSNQPGILAAKAGLEEADARIKLADLKRKPNLGFGLDYAFVSKRSDMNVSDNGKDILMPMVSLSLPIFRKKNASVKKEAELKKESLTAGLEMEENQVKNKWMKADYQIDKADTEIELYRVEIEKTNLLLRLLTTEYSNDNRNFEELLITQQRLLQLQLAQVRAEVNDQEARFQKEYLAGTLLNQN
ncbi:MAG: TolC family protein [Roseivirga sp.]|nr:TolC family protein [Roseivirga sp.]